MTKFFQNEIAAYSNEKDRLKNVEFVRDFQNSVGAERGTLLEIIPVHIRNPPKIQFMAFLESLSDRFNPSYSKEQPFGRIDPYYVWKSADRSISVTLNIPSSSPQKALDNFNNLSWFLASLYPAYKKSQAANTISATPIFRVRYANLISSRTAGGQGVLGIIQGVNVTHKLDSGMIHIQPGRALGADGLIADRILKESGFDSIVFSGDVLQFPKDVQLSFQINVIHDHEVGWDHTTGDWLGGSAAPAYPYGFGLQRDVDPVPTDAFADVPGSPGSNANAKVQGDAFKG